MSAIKRCHVAVILICVYFIHFCSATFLFGWSVRLLDEAQIDHSPAPNREKRRRLSLSEYYPGRTATLGETSTRRSYTKKSI